MAREHDLGSGLTYRRRKASAIIHACGYWVLPTCMYYVRTYSVGCKKVLVIDGGDRRHAGPSNVGKPTTALPQCVTISYLVASMHVPLVLYLLGLLL
jgi:hypothetical protein